MKLQRVAMAMFVIFLTFYLLHVGKSLLLPLVIAASIASLISILAHAIAALKFRGMAVPGIFAKILALALILLGLGFIINLITYNIANVLKVAPEYQNNLLVWYQQNVEVKLQDVSLWLGVSEVPNLKQALRQLDLGAYLQDLSGTVRDLISRVGIIIVYLIFLLLEQRTFAGKVQALVVDPKRRDDVFELGEDSPRYSYLHRDKGADQCSDGTAQLLGAFLGGGRFASFWAVLIFLLNFIPTIGSIITTLFPSLLTLIQFDTMGPFVVTISVLTSLQFCIGSLLEPRLMGQRLNLSPIVILLSLGLGVACGGFLACFLRADYRDYHDYLFLFSRLTSDRHPLVW